MITNDATIMIAPPENIALEATTWSKSADLHISGRDDVALETAINRLSLEPAVTSASWSVLAMTGSAIGTEQ